jgi:hypothetical protein
MEIVCLKHFSTKLIYNIISKIETNTHTAGECKEQRYMTSRVAFDLCFEKAELCYPFVPVRFHTDSNLFYFVEYKIKFPEDRYERADIERDRNVKKK